MLGPEEPKKPEEHGPQEEADAAPMAEDIGSTALVSHNVEEQALTREQVGWPEPISDTEFRDNPIYPRHKLVRAEEILAYAKKEAALSKEVHDSSSRFKRWTHGTGKILNETEARAALTEEHYQSELREAQRYIERHHAEAERYVQAWQEYIVTQQILADALGKEPRILGIEDFIQKWDEEAGRDSMNDLNYERRSKDAGISLAVKDFFLPHMLVKEKGAEDAYVALEAGNIMEFHSSIFGARPDEGYDRDFRVELGMSANNALREVEEKGYDQVIKFDRLYGTIMYPGGNARRRLIVESHYVPVPAEVVNLVKLAGINGLNTKTALYQQGQYRVPREEIEISAEVIDISGLQRRAREEAAPYRKTIQLPGVGNHRNGTEDIVTLTVGADSEAELQAKILEEAQKRGAIEMQ